MRKELKRECRAQKYQSKRHKKTGEVKTDPVFDLISRGV